MPRRCPFLRCSHPPGSTPFGTDRQGRDLLAVMVAGTPLTLWIGFVAGFIGVGSGRDPGVQLRPITAGWWTPVIRSVADIGLTIPGLLVLIIIAVSLRGSLTVNQMAMVVSLLAWLNPTRTIRSQVLTLRERGYVEIARLNGMSGPEIIVAGADAETCCPISRGYAGQQRIGCKSWHRLGSRCWGWDLSRHPTLGMTLYWVFLQCGDHQRLDGGGGRRRWVVIVIVFLGLFFLTVGLDEIANPRLRRTA